LALHLDMVRQAHLIVCDAERVIWREIQGVANLPQAIMDCIRTFSPQRVVYLPSDTDLRRRIRALQPRPGSAEAVALASRDDVDVVVIGPDTMSAVELAGVTHEKIVRLAESRRGRWAERPRGVNGGFPVGGLPRRDFLDLIVGPIFRHAARVTVFDKMLGGVILENQGNWKDFARTVREIHRLWRASPGAADRGARFTVITMDSDSTLCGPLPADHVGKIRERLDIRPVSGESPKFRLRLKPKGDLTLNAMTHDRYLQTNQEFTLGISRGFDLLSATDICREADVYLRCDGQSTLLARIDAYRDVGTDEW